MSAGLNLNKLLRFLCLGGMPGWIAFFLAAVHLQALDPGKQITQYRHRQWFQQQGLPKNSIQDVVQTPDGYIWAATPEGLARFNGAEFKVFNMANTPELPGNNITSLLVRADGSLWIGLGDDKGVASYKNERFQVRIRGAELKGRAVISLCEDSHGALWIGTRHNTVRFEGDKLIEFTPEQGWWPSSTREIFRDRTGGMWLATENGVFHFSNGKFNRYNTAQGLDSQDCNSVCADRDGTIWAGTQKGVSRLRDGRFQNFPMQDGLNKNTTEAVHCDREGNLWIGATWGLNRWNPLTQQIEYGPNPELFDNVMAFFEDREGSVWVGTDNGLHQLADTRFTFYGAAQGLLQSTIYTVCQDRRKNIWMGSRLGGAYCFANGVFRNFTSDDGLSDDLVTSIVQDSKGALWFGTRFAGLNRYQDGVIDKQPIPSPFPGQYVTALYEDRAGVLWVGTAAGLFLFHDGKFEPLPLPGIAVNTLIRQITESRDGSLWVATGGGLWRRHGKEWDVYSTGDGLPSNSIFHIGEDSQGTIWAGAEDGFAQFRENGRWKAVQPKDGIQAQDVYWFSEDRLGDFWFISSAGIFRIQKKAMLEFARGGDPKIVPDLFDRDDGLESSECRWNGSSAGCRDDSGRLWFATVRGLAMADPANLRTNPVAPPVVIERVMVDGKEASTKPGLRLQPGAKRLEIQFVALSYRAPGKLQFQTKLEGLDDDWVSIERSMPAVYSKLRPGHYRFLVKARNEDGVWNTTGGSLAFSVLPHFFQTPWFAFLCTTGAVLAIWTGHRLRLNRHQRRERELTRLVDERTLKLMESARERQKLEEQLAESRKMEAVGQLASGMAHHFNNILTVLFGHATLLDREFRGQIPMNESVDAIKNSSERASVLVQQLMAFSRTQFMKAQLVDIDELLIGLNGELRAAVGASVAINLSLAGGIPRIKLDKAQMAKVLMILAANARDAMPSGGQFNLATQLVSLKSGDARLPIESMPGRYACVSASDTGCGLGPEALAHVFEPFFTTKDVGAGVGLSLSSAYGIVKQQGGWILVESIPGRGATFMVFFPIPTSSN
jgi:ligand-binding sensor domain-containing protein/signal transduction histidine kinase